MRHNNVKPVVVGVDGTHGNEGALRYAAKAAQQSGTELRLVHVSPSYPPMSPMMPALSHEIAEAGEQIIKQARNHVADMMPDLPVSTRRLTGPRIVALVEAADDARMLVVGRESRSALERLMGAGTTSAVATHAKVPVFVVPEHWAPAEGEGPVVVGLKSAANADELLGAGFRAAATRGVPLVVVHSWKMPDEYIDRIEVRSHEADWVARGEELAEKALAPWKHEYADVPVTIKVVHDEPGRALVKETEGASLLVLVRRAPVRLLGQHLGGTARAVIRAAACPVEIVPGTDVVPEVPGLEVEDSGAMVR